MSDEAISQQSDRDPSRRGDRDLSRRRALTLGGAGAVAVGIGALGAANALAGDATATASGGADGTAEECYRLTAESIEGPYYLDYDLFRRDITEDRPGIPMTLRLKVIDGTSCRPLRDAAVDIWHCDAVGVYSGYTDMGSGGGGGSEPPPTGTPTDTPTGTPTGGPGGGGGHQEPTDDTTFLRGSRMTDRHGIVEFRTVFPGWYQGRAVHIHTKVHVDGKLTEDGYEGGHQCHTGQLYFEEKAVLASAEADPYRTNTTTRTTLDEDFIYPGGGAQGGLLKLRYKPGRITDGVAASLTVAVDPDATHDGSDAGGPQPTGSPSSSSS